MQQYKVAICRFPGSGSEHWGCVSWLMKLAVELSRDPAISGLENIVESDTPITMTRNRAVKKALALDCDYILMVDSDMVPDYLVGRDPLARPFWATAWNWMLNRREDEEDYRAKLSHSDGMPPGGEDAVLDQFPPATIAAPYCGPPPHENPLVFRWKNYESDNPDPDIRLEMIDREEAAVRVGFEEVPALPTGLILYDARVFKRLKPPWFAYDHNPDCTEKETTEDVYQTRNAHMLGMPQFVLWDAWAAHVKTKYVGKPKILTKESVHKTFVDLVLHGWESNRKKIAFVSPHDVPRGPAVVTGQFKS